MVVHCKVAISETTYTQQQKRLSGLYSYICAYIHIKHTYTPPCTHIEINKEKEATNLRVGTIEGVGDRVPKRSLREESEGEKHTFKTSCPVSYTHNTSV